MMLSRYVIDLLKHTTSTCVVGCLVFVVVIGGLMLICWYTWLVHILSFIDISYDVLLEEYLLDVLVMGYILGHVVDDNHVVHH
jgi:hypothetical protein